jgi:drug/metabolite transporter (DMT)-like permease
VRSAPHQPSRFLLGAVLGGILLVWCFNYTAGKIALRHMDPFSLASIRTEVAALLMLAIHFARRERTRFRWRDAWTFAYLAFFGVVLNQGCFTVGLNYTTSERSVLLVALAPIIVLVLARFMGLEALTPGKTIGMVIAFAGVVLLETERGSLGHTPLVVGDMITLIGVIGFSVFSVLGKRLLAGGRPEAYDSISFNTFTLVAAAILLLPLAVRQGIHLDWQQVGWAGWAGLLYMAIFSSVLAYTLFYWILKYMEASRVAGVDYLQPFIVVLLSMVFLGERPTGHLVSAGALVLLGVYFVERVSGSKTEHA